MYATHNERLRQRGEELMAELKEQIDQGLQVQESLHAAALDTWGMSHYFFGTCCIRMILICGLAR